MNYKNIVDYYGEPGANQVYCKLPYKMKLAWDLDITVSKFSCHRVIQYNLEAIFDDVLNTYGQNNISDLGLDIFGGCLSIRKMRGGSKPSIHSWGLAVDLNPLENQLRWDNTKAVFAQDEYKDFWSIVEKWGGYSLGREKNYDWMHFQFVPIT